MIVHIESELSQSEIDRRRDGALRQLLKTPPQTHKDLQKRRTVKKQASEKKPAK